VRLGETARPYPDYHVDGFAVDATAHSMQHNEESLQRSQAYFTDYPIVPKVVWTIAIAGGILSAPAKVFPDRKYPLASSSWQDPHSCALLSGTRRGLCHWRSCSPLQWEQCY
jgi:hypothetical protein